MSIPPWLLAECASAAYRPPGSRPDSDAPMGIGGVGSDNQKASVGFGGRLVGGVWRVVTEFDQRDYCLWKNGSRAILAFRGTHIGAGSWGSTKKTASDLVADSAIIAGSSTFRNSARYYECLHAAERALVLPELETLYFTGHSLGGRCAIEVFRTLSGRKLSAIRLSCTAFNPGYGPSDAYRAFEGKKVFGGITIYTAKNDLISLAPTMAGSRGTKELGTGHGMDQYVSILRSEDGLSNESYSPPTSQPVPAVNPRAPTAPKGGKATVPAGSELPPEAGITPTISS